MRILILMISLLYSFSSVAVDYIDPTKHVLVFYGNKSKTKETERELSQFNDVKDVNGGHGAELVIPGNGKWAAQYHPFLKFYDNESLDGDVVIRINHEGVFFKGKQVCSVYLLQWKRHSPSQYKVRFYTENEEGRREKGCPFLDSRTLILRKIFVDSERRGYALYAENYDGEVAKVKMEIQGKEQNLYAKIDENHSKGFEHYSPSVDMYKAAFKKTPKLKKVHKKVLKCLKKKSIECLENLPHVETEDEAPLKEIFGIYKKYHFPDRGVFEVLHRALSMNRINIQRHKTFLRMKLSIGNVKDYSRAINVIELKRKSGEVESLGFYFPRLSNIYDDVEIWPLEFRGVLEYYLSKSRSDGQEYYNIFFRKPYKTMESSPYKK